MLELYFFNVGHGDSIAIKLPNEEWGIIDCHRNFEEYAPPVLTFLRNQGITKLNFVCITHPHSDHIRGIDVLVENLDIDKLYLFGIQTGSPCERTKDCPLIKALLTVTENAKKREKMEVLSINDIKTIGGIEFKVLNPSEEIRDELRMKKYITDSQDFNRESIVIFFEYAGKNVLLAGDITPNFWNEIYKDFNEKIDLIKISHHGSKYSNRYDDLSQYLNESAVAIISTDGGKRFSGVPDLDFIVKLEKDLKCNVLCTSDLNITEEYISKDENLLTNDTIDFMSVAPKELKYDGYIKCVIDEAGNITSEVIRSVTEPFVL